MHYLIKQKLKNTWNAPASMSRRGIFHRINNFAAVDLLNATMSIQKFYFVNFEIITTATLNAFAF